MTCIINLKALTHGVDFSAAEEYLDMVAAHKHRKKVSKTGECTHLLYIHSLQVHHWVQKHGPREGQHGTAFLMFSKKQLPFCQLEVFTQQSAGIRSAVSSSVSSGLL